MMGEVKWGFWFLFLLMLLSSVIAFETPERTGYAHRDETVITEFYDGQGVAHDMIYASRVRITADYIGTNGLTLKKVYLLLPDGREYLLAQPNKHFSRNLQVICEDDCDWSAAVSPNTLITGLKFIWVNGGDSDSFQYWIASNADANPFAEPVESLCSDNNVDNDWDGSANCGDVDCVDAQNCNFACSPNIINQQYRVFEIKVKDKITSDVLPEQDAPLGSWLAYGCRAATPSQKVLFDLKPDQAIDRTHAARIFVKANQPVDVDAIISWDDSYVLYVYPVNSDGLRGPVQRYPGTIPSGPGALALSLHFNQGWNEVVFYVWNQGGPGYGKVEFTSKTLQEVFSQIQSNFYAHELVCGDTVNEDSDAWTDMADWDCQELCRGMSPPQGGDPLFDGKFLFTSGDADYPAGPVPSPSATTGADWCCGDDTVIQLTGQQGCMLVGGGCEAQSQNQQVCENIAWCNYYAAGCSGTPRPCNRYEENADCTAHGCQWKQNTQTCTGTPPPCTSKTTSTSCTAHDGCSWSDASSCTSDATYCSIQTPEQCRVKSGCDWKSGDVLVQKDYASIIDASPEAPNTYLCMNDSDGAGNIIRTPGNWVWWNAKLSSDIFRMHEVLPQPDKTHLTELLANGAQWYYCAAASDPLLNDGARLGEYAPLPDSDVEFIPNFGTYQSWPDTDCDRIPKVNDPEGENNLYGDPACVGENPPAYCWSCPEGHQGVDCFGPMDYCSYIRKGNVVDHLEFSACQNKDLPTVDECKGGTSDPCQAQSFSGRVGKEDWGYPAGTNCEAENTAERCKDGRDNDFDGKIDCADPDCFREYIAHPNDPDWQLSDCPDVMETDCGDGADNDGDDDYDCDDLDCSTDSHCVGDTELPPQVSDNQKFVCYENAAVNFFAECCPSGDSSCYNADRFLSHKELFGTGVSWLKMNAMDEIGAASNYLDNVQNYDRNGQKVVAILPVQKGEDVAEISLSLWFNDLSLKWKPIYVGGGPSTEYFVKDYISNGNNVFLWHKMVIPDDLIDDSKTISAIQFIGTSHLSVDNIFFKKKTDRFSETRYCAGTGAWIADLDEDAGACNAQNPQGMLIGGFGGTGWTGRGCCGDDASGNLLENSGFESFAVNYQVQPGAAQQGWSRKDGTQMATVENVDGSKAVHIRGTNAIEGIFSGFNRFENLRYRLSARVKILSGSVRLGKGNTNCYQVFQKPQDEPRFVDISVEFNNAECGSQNYLAYVYSASASSEFYVDDVSLIALPESYADTERGCFNNNVILHDRVVGDLFRTERLTGDGFYKYKDLLFFRPDFFACAADGSGEYAGQNMVGGPSPGPLVDPANYKGICAREGSYFCAWNNSWQSISKESEVFEWDGGLVRCRDGSPESVSVSYDWFGHHSGVCDAGTCFCPTEAAFGADGLEECDDYVANGGLGLDAQSCLASGEIINDHFCNAGNWTTRTSLVAAFLHDYLVDKTKKNFVLTCNLPSALLYEQYLGGEVGHLSDADITGLMTSVCLLEVKNAQWKTENVIVGFALNIDKTPDQVGPIMDAAYGGDAGTRLNVNYEYVRNNQGRNLRWDECVGNGRCINADRDRFKAYFFGEKDLFFLSTVDLHMDKYPDQGEGNQPYFDKWEGLFKEFFQDLRVWAKSGILQKYEIPEISASMERYYAAQRVMDGGVLKRVIVSVDAGWPEGASGPQEIVTGRFKNFDPLRFITEIARKYPDSTFVNKPAEKEVFFYGPRQASADAMIADLYNVRLDDTH